MALSEYVKIWGKRATQGLQTAYYNRLSKKTAFQALLYIEKKKGKLSKIHKKAADEYAIEVLGGNVYAPWLYVYSAVTGKFVEGWIPDNYYHLVLIPKIQGNYGKISFLKPLNQKLFSASISADIAYFIHGEWFDKDFRQIGKEKLKSISFVENKFVVYKTDQSYQGRGIFVRNKDDFNSIELEGKGNGILQRYIEQHSFFADLLPGSVANIRLTTVIDPSGSPDIRSAYLRLGRAGDTHVKSDSHVRIPIHPTTGMLNEEGYLTDWTTVVQHPDSRISFSGKLIPEYRNCVEMALHLHRNFPMVKAIGWDIIVDKKNRPILMEWNGYGNDIKFSEATQGPCFKDLNWIEQKA